MPPRDPNQSTSTPRVLAALDQADVGLALLSASEPAQVEWANATYTARAERAGLEPIALARLIIRSGGSLDLNGLRCRTAVQSLSGQTLLELFPPQETGSRLTQPTERDELTGVLSRRSLQNRIDGWFTARSEQPFAMVFLDLNGFKSVNDRQGHLQGDTCLREVGRRLRRAVRGEDLVGRFGGDEFVLLLAGVTSPTDYEPVAQRLAAEIERPIETQDGPVRVGASLGVAYSSADYPDAESMLAAADRAMYADKPRCDPPADVADPARLG